MNCDSGGERICCHNSLRDTVYNLAAEAGLGASKEVRFLLPGQDSRPADVLLPNWAVGEGCGARPHGYQSMGRAATTPGYAITVAQNRKVQGTEEACRAQGISYLPMVVDTV